MVVGAGPALMGVPGLLVAVEIGVTIPGFELVSAT
jgi:hypothetical protein